ncbi:carbonic anhydrase [Mycetocola zhujimingii]|uniref:Carbonic anhydrase n=1 Tax=Mycetocola zhujimingii TaxID=2079792 RepID=A0A2U1THY2_9MICO|nr:carbonic anhydrase [Mycetocola zhujimingii]AWB86939.1 carbonic anhydrase [Mycetocola zhujimingii]PWC08492.1 carbonic anhydrase [Mycetocola zhujimingii]
MPTTRPTKAWEVMMRGNARFVAGEPQHPRQDVERRESLAHAQTPDVVLFGCSDSRLAAEIIFDKGLGDLFVVRNAGQVISDSVVGSIEYAVGVLGVPLIVVLGHDECGAVRAAIDSIASDAPPLPHHIYNLIRQIVPAVKRVTGGNGVNPAEVDASEVGREHLRDTVAELLERSEMISDAVASGVLGIVGANYKLLEGTAVPDIIIGNISTTDIDAK